MPRCGAGIASGTAATCPPGQARGWAWGVAWGTVHPELRKLEAVMVRLQSEEIEQMARWYQQWFGTANR